MRYDLATSQIAAKKLGGANATEADAEWGLFVVGCDGTHLLVARGLRQAFAERAAHCMNAHGELLDALENAAASLDNVLVAHGGSMTEGDRIGRAHVVGHAQALIEILEGETGE